MKCWDCNKRQGFVPAVIQAGVIFKVCTTCWSKWATYMHRDGCNCDHCEGQNGR